MSLLDLTLRNVRRNFRLYSVYLFSMITGVLIYFTFSSLMYNEDILHALKARQNFQTGVTIASAVIFLFIVFFILYANSFFMRQRKKEFGMYLLYGMSEKQVTLMIFYETLTIGAVSLAAGILLGGLLSKLFGMLLMNLMDYEQAVSLSFPLEAVGSTAGVFLLLAVIISIQSFFMVRRVQLIDLFHAKARSEKPVAVSAPWAILSAAMLAASYLLLASGKGSVMWQDYTSASLIACTIGIIAGTYLFFRQFAGWLLRLVSRRKGYHEGNTVLWTAALRFQIRGNTLNLSFISLFSTVLIMLMCFVSINYTVQFQAVGQNLPNDVAFEAQDPALPDRLALLMEEEGHPVKKHRTLEALETEPVTSLDTAFENPEYYLPKVLLVSQSAYNEIAAMRGDGQSVQLQGKQAAALAQGSDFPQRYPSGGEPPFRVNAQTETSFTLVEKKDYALLGWATDPASSMLKKPAVLVVSDEAYRELAGQAPHRTFHLYQIGNAKGAEKLSEKLHAAVTETRGAYYSSFADVYSRQIEGSSLMLFSGAFLALIALFALASVIYFKQLREATEARPSFTILRKMGVEQRQMKSVIRKQLLFVFLPPLALGLMNSGLIIKTYIVDSVKDYPNISALVWGTLGAYFLLYALLYLSSSSLYYKIASGRTA